MSPKGDEYRSGEKSRRREDRQGNHRSNSLPRVIKGKSSSREPDRHSREHRHNDIERMNQSMPQMDYSEEHRRRHDFERMNKSMPHLEHSDENRRRRGSVDHDKPSRGKSEQRRQYQGRSDRRSGGHFDDSFKRERERIERRRDERPRAVARPTPNHHPKDQESNRRSKCDDRTTRSDERYDRSTKSRLTKSTRGASAEADRRVDDTAVPRRDKTCRSTARRGSMGGGRKHAPRRHKEYTIKTNEELSIFLQRCFEKEFMDSNKSDAEILDYLQKCFEEEFYERKEFYEQLSSIDPSIKKPFEEIARELEILFEREFNRYMKRNGQKIEQSREKIRQESADEKFAQYLQKSFEKDFVRQVKSNIKRRESLSRDFQSEPRIGDRRRTSLSRDFASEPRIGDRRSRSRSKQHETGLPLSLSKNLKF